MILLNEHNRFPPLHHANKDGLLAIGGDLGRERLLEAYRNGIFPWYDDGPILWWSPDPRMVLFPPELVISRSMQKVIRQQQFQFSTNRSFEEVIHHCKSIKRTGQQGTWITPELETAFINLHYEGYAMSGEVWQQEKLAGGIYGLRIGNVFFAESMFSLATNASKFGLIKLVQQLEATGVMLIDCQVYSPHLATMGARLISRNAFSNLLKLHTR